MRANNIFGIRQYPEKIIPKFLIRLMTGQSLTIHGSGKNISSHKRRFYINGYVRASDCDRGEWAFRDGQPVPLGPEPALVHYDQLFDRPGPHYTN